MANFLGDKIKKQREIKGYSLDKLAEISETSKSYLWELENRDTTKPSAEKLTKIADALSLTIDYLLGDSESPDEGVMKEAFFRKFNKLDKTDQDKIEDIIEMWSKK